MIDSPLPPKSITRQDRYRGCLLGGAVGDALGAPVEFLKYDEIVARYGASGIADFDEAYGRVGAITDDTQMTLFTAEGLLRAFNRWSVKGYCNTAAVVYHAYLRWLETQGIHVEDSRDPDVMPGWLITIKDLHSRRAPGLTCLSALQSGHMELVHPPANDSKGCGAVMRGAPVGMITNVQNPFVMGCEVGALTHGHPSGYLAAGAFAVIIRELCAGATMPSAVQSGIARVEQVPSSGEVSTALHLAVRFAADGTEPLTAIERLGSGAVAEEALAIAVYCALSANDNFERGVRSAVNHSGDSDSTGAIAGNLLGAALGVTRIPKRWLDRLELRDVITEIADDLVTEHRDDRTWFERYPPN